LNIIHEVLGIDHVKTLDLVDENGKVSCGSFYLRPLKLVAA
jgi:hypothetical protein